MSDIVIGKFTLESLSTGMYADPRAIYREYIQNATDSIDHAMRDGLISKDDAEIHITITPEKREIRMERKVSGDWKKIAELCHREKLMAAGYHI